MGRKFVGYKSRGDDDGNVFKFIHVKRTKTKQRQDLGGQGRSALLPVSTIGKRQSFGWIA